MSNENDVEQLLQAIQRVKTLMSKNLIVEFFLKPKLWHLLWKLKMLEDKLRREHPWSF